MNKDKNGTIYIVPTPIGNLRDIGQRSLEILSNVDYTVCEDTRKTLKLLNSYNIKNNLISYYKDVELKKSKKIIELLESGKNIALVSDSGTPLISDPGNHLIQEAIKNNININSIPGPTAFISAIVASGFDLEHFIFYGFLSNPKEDLRKIKNLPYTTAIYESPHRILKTLELISDIMPKHNLCVVKEISKINESYYRGKASDLLNMGIIEKGEFVIIIESSDKAIDINDYQLSLPEHLEYYVNRGFNKSDAIKMVAKDLKLPKNDIYMQFHKK